MNAVKASLSQKIQTDLRETLKNSEATLHADSPRDENGTRIRVIRRWLKLFHRVTLVDTAGTITYILWRQEERDLRILREKEERQRLEAIKAAVKTKTAEEKPKKGVKPSICQNTKGRALSPSKAIPDNGWTLRAMDCPHKRNRQVNRENKYSV